MVKFNGVFLFVFFPVFALFGNDSGQTPRPVKEKEYRKDHFQLFWLKIDPRAHQDKYPKKKVEADDRDGEVFGEFFHYRL